MLATRIAWPIRVIGEEQIRMAVAGYDSMFNHPVSRSLAGAMGKKKGEGLADNFFGEAADQTGAIAAGARRLDRPGPRLTAAASHVHKGDRRGFNAYKRAVASETAKLAQRPDHVEDRHAPSRSTT